jgi:hypothetical protein
VQNIKNIFRAFRKIQGGFVLLRIQISSPRAIIPKLKKNISPSSENLSNLSAKVHKAISADSQHIRPRISLLPI